MRKIKKLLDGGGGEGKNVGMRISPISFSRIETAHIRAHRHKLRLIKKRLQVAIKPSRGRGTVPGFPRG